MLIVEGPDGAGKTTLIRQIQERFDIPIAPRVVSKDTEAMVDLRAWVDENLEEGFQWRLFDRHRLISETIYGPTLRVEQEAGFTDLKWLAPRMKQLYEVVKPTIIYCLPSLEVVKQNVTQDPDNLTVAEFIEPIYTAYVSRISLDEAFSPGIIKVWDYQNSLTIDQDPAWLNTIMYDMRKRLGK